MHAAVVGVWGWNFSLAHFLRVMPCCMEGTETWRIQHWGFIGAWNGELMTPCCGILFSTDTGIAASARAASVPESIPILSPNVQAQTSWLRSLAITPDSTQVISTNGDNSVRIWNLATGECEMAMKVRGQVLCGVGVGGQVQVWEDNKGGITQRKLLRWNAKYL